MKRLKPPNQAFVRCPGAICVAPVSRPAVVRASWPAHRGDPVFYSLFPVPCSLSFIPAPFTRPGITTSQIPGSNRAQ
jgi:hypothetical protein